VTGGQITLTEHIACICVLILLYMSLHTTIYRYTGSLHFCDDTQADLVGGRLLLLLLLWCFDRHDQRCQKFLADTTFESERACAPIYINDTIEQSIHISSTSSEEEKQFGGKKIFLNHSYINQIFSTRTFENFVFGVIYSVYLCLAFRKEKQEANIDVVKIQDKIAIFIDILFYFMRSIFCF
jgi:hypothetical protein